MNNILQVAVSENEANKRRRIKNRRRNSKNTKRRFREVAINAQRKVEIIDVLDLDASISVWQSVVVQAFYDLITISADNEQKLNKANAIAWFAQGVSRENGFQPTDFELVCELAQLDPDAVMRLANKVIQEERQRRRHCLVSGFNFRTVRRNASNRIPKKNNKENNNNNKKEV